MSARVLSVMPPRNTRYSLETCAGCHGSGINCSACEGNGYVLVMTPPVKCGHCLGSGIERNRPASSSPVCISCEGTGWENVIRVVK